MFLVLVTIVAALAAVLHVFIFVMESLRWTRPSVWRRFGIREQADADTIRPMAYNQGFYNLFLAIGVVIGIVMLWAGGADAVAHGAGKALVLFSLGCMVAAAVVLVTTGARYVRAALIQGVVPVIGFVLTLLI